MRRVVCAVTRCVLCCVLRLQDPRLWSFQLAGKPPRDVVLKLVQRSSCELAKLEKYGGNARLSVVPVVTILRGVYDDWDGVVMPHVTTLSELLEEDSSSQVAAFFDGLLAVRACSAWLWVDSVTLPLRKLCIVLSHGRR